MLKKEKEILANGRKLPALYTKYLAFLNHDRGLDPGTIDHRKEPVLLFLERSPEYSSPTKIRKIKPSAIQDYIIEAGNSLSRAKRKNLVTTMRDFFRFIYLKEYHKKNLSEAVPTIKTYKLESLPRGIDWESVKKLLTVPNRNYPKGRRDYAVIQLIATYGIRQSQVTSLLFKDIDWKKGTIYFKPMKGGRPLFIQLEAAVAEALLDYIKKDRQNTKQPYVFISYARGREKDQLPMKHLWCFISRYLKKIGIKGPNQPLGPHSIRHAFATRLLAEKRPMKIISDLLGHRSLQSTFIYTKVDFGRLRELAMEWPEVNT